MENNVDYKYKGTGNYEIRLVRTIVIHPETNWISYDTTNVQYIRFQSIEHAQAICYSLGIKEYEIVEYGPDDAEHWNHCEIVYRTPLAQQAVNALEAQRTARNLQDKLIRLENRKKLENFPKKELIRTFSNGYKLFRIIGEREKKASCNYIFIKDSHEREFYISHYVTRGTNRFRRAKLTEDLTRWEITEEEADELISMFDSLRTRQNEINNMII